MLIIDTCIMWFHFDCIMQLKKYHIANNVCSRKSATTYGDLPDCLVMHGSITFYCTTVQYPSHQLYTICHLWTAHTSMCHPRRAHILSILHALHSIYVSCLYCHMLSSCQSWYEIRQFPQTSIWTLKLRTHATIKIIILATNALPHTEKSRFA